MFEETRDRKARLGMSWIKSSDSGNTFLCPAGAAGSLRSASDEQLRELCVEESGNPQND
jgi:hypothetical protein